MPTAPTSAHSCRGGQSSRPLLPWAGASSRDPGPQGHSHASQEAWPPLLGTPGPVQASGPLPEPEPAAETREGAPLPPTPCGAQPCPVSAQGRPQACRGSCPEPPGGERVNLHANRSRAEHRVRSGGRGLPAAGRRVRAHSPGSKCELKAKLGLKKEDDMARAAGSRSERPPPRPAPRHRPAPTAAGAAHSPPSAPSAAAAQGVRGRRGAGGAAATAGTSVRAAARRAGAGAARKHWRERARWGGGSSRAGGARAARRGTRGLRGARRRGGRRCGGSGHRDARRGDPQAGGH